MIDQSALRAQLQRRLLELARRHDRIEAHIVRDEALPSDFDDQMSEHEMAEVIDRLDESTRAEIAAVRRAIGRIDEGSFGVCDSCGEAIGDGRLSVLPTATRCVDCADQGP